MNTTHEIFRHLNEQHIVTLLADTILNAGYMIEIHNGAGLDNLRLELTADRDEVMEALFATGEEKIYLADRDGERMGGFFLVYGKDFGEDVICDWSDNEVCTELMKPALELCEAIRKWAYPRLSDLSSEQYRAIAFAKFPAGTHYDDVIVNLAISQILKDEVDDVETADLDRDRLARLNKLYIIRAAVEDMVDNDLRVSTLNVVRSQDVAEIMCSVAASDLNTVLSVYTLDGQKIGDVCLHDEDDYEVFGTWEPSLAEELDRAFELINEVNDNGSYLGDNPFWAAA